ncbi:methyltransferase [Candidatus Woesearchaeota archaeon]|nr:methyltransferase [Candidatus Woesearchaeota archaeon]
MYQPAEDSYLLQKFVRKYAFGRVLDLGTGSGIQALTAVERKDVREVIAVDINENAIKELKKEVSKKKIRKIAVKKSDLFSNVKDKFDTIIFNPPYLPQDKIGNEIIEDSALYGGKHGWELSEKFFNKVNQFLVAKGKILFLFSSLTNKEKIEEIISHNLLEFKELEKQKLPMFETLYVYLIEKSKILKELERKNIENLKYLTHGKRGNIFTGISDKSKRVKTHFAKKEIVKVGIKVKRKESSAIERMRNEANWLKILNKKNIGPRLLFSGEDYLVYEFVEGEFILDWIKDNNKKDIQKVLVAVLKQCFELDQLGVNKEEMHHPLKHIIVTKDNHPVLLDFERCSRSDKVKNVTQFVEFICRIREELENKDIKLNKIDLREKAKSYKDDINPKNLEIIIKYLSS